MKQRLKKYAIHTPEFVRMVREQHNKCAICGAIGSQESVSLAIDHCHYSGNVRGLLCFNCNTGLGKFKDDVNLLQSAIDYLTSHKNKFNNQ